MGTRTFFLGFSVAAGLVLTMVAATNVLIDSAGVYYSEPDEVERLADQYVARLVRSPFGMVMPSFPERRVKIRLAKGGQADCYAVGASHVMGLSLDKAPSLRRHCASLINLGVPGAGYEDALIMMHAVAEKPGARLLVQVPPWFFKKNSDIRWQELLDDYAFARTFFFGFAEQIGPRLEKLKSVVNKDYLLANLEHMKENGISVSGLLATAGRRDRGPDPFTEALPGQVGPDQAVFGRDGSLTYSRHRIDESWPRNETVACGEYKVSRPFVLPSVVAEFETALHVLLKKGVGVSLVLMPYHPGMFLCGGETVKAMKETENAARDLARRLGIPVWGSFHPHDHGMTGKDFLDFMHVDVDSLHKLRLAD